MTMLPSDLTDAVYRDEDKAREYLETVRWPDGAICAHCGATADDVTKLDGEKHRKGLYQCNQCKEQFTVTVGTLYERSHIPLNKWLLATHLLCASKKGMSAHQLMRTLGLGSYRTAWFMAHRIREGMKPTKPEPLGGKGKTIEIDETYIGQKKGREKRKGFAHKHTVVALVERGGPVLSFHIKGNMSRKTAREILFHNADLKSKLMTDEAAYYKTPGDYFEKHAFVTHSADEYVRKEGDTKVHTNTIEGVFSIFKRGMVGTYQHCGEQHLHRYLAEFDFRYNNRIALGIDDAQRAHKALKGIEGKRLTYRRTNPANTAS
jgi:transposase-like protein